MLSKIQIKFLLLVVLFACANPPSHTQAVDDGKIALGMMLVEADGESRLILAACDPEQRCINALQNERDNSPYYFAALENSELRHKLRMHSVLKLTATVAGVAALTGLGLVSIKHIGKLAKILRIEPSSINANTSAAAIAIAALTSMTMKLGNYTWGKDERMLSRYWDNIFVVHASFDNPKLIDTPTINLIETLATELHLKVNPSLY